MLAYELTGPTSLSGEINIHGAKNSALPILAATILCRGRCLLQNVPAIEDVHIACQILHLMGAEVTRQESGLLVDTTIMENCPIPASLAGKMRASILFLGALMGRFGSASIALPGGCPLGQRPVDLHLSSLRKLGAEVEVRDSALLLSCPCVCGARIELPFPSVGATENILLAASRCAEETVLLGAAKEPEIADLASFLQQAGAKISGGGTDRILIRGTDELHGVTHTVIPDRIETATYLCAAAGCGGELTLRNTDSAALASVMEVLRGAGCEIESDARSIFLRSSGQLTMPQQIVTLPYPGFATDAQPAVMAALLRAEGTCVFRETIFERRFAHTAQMRKLGADVSCCGNDAVLRGVRRLFGNTVQAQDLRGGAALLIACMMSEGKSIVTGVKHVERGYDNLEKNLAELGAGIKKVEISP